MAYFDNENSNPLEGKEINGIYNAIKTIIELWSDGTFTEIVGDWKWIFSYSVQYKWVIAFNLALGILGTTMGLVGTVVSKYLIDIVTGYKTDKLSLLVGLMIGSTVFSLTVGNLLSRFTLKIGIDIGNAIQADIFDKIIDSDWLALDCYNNGDLLNRFSSDVGTISGNAISWLPTIVLAVYRFIATFFIILHYDKVMAILAFASAPFLLVSSHYLISKQREYNKRVREMSSEVMSFHVETFYNFDMIKSFGISSKYSKKLRWWQQKFKDITLEYNLFSIKTGIFLTILGKTVTGIAFFYCLFLLWNHSITYGTMTLFLSQRSALQGSFHSVLGILPAFLQTSVSAHRIRELVDLPKETHIERSSELDAYIDKGFSIRMEDVNFSYIQNYKVITDSDFVANPGEIVALVGPSGEGKTTMIRLILGLIHPDEGSVTIESGGVKVEANANTRHLFAYVPQTNAVLTGTVAENLRMVNEDATDEELIDALKLACAWDFVKDREGGLEAKVGERGGGFSAGQAQRLSIARAILAGAPILLLDEATSALDVTTERQVLRNIIQRKPNRTVIVTTHRPSVLNLSQRVYRVMQTHVTELDEEEAARIALEF
ncbi:MAG: ABC transporter ATP-binding protein [Lachnospiraceae bacterium]|nr:ABC transporter ATP-binding protein [Lachnospiraceae bacterium]